MPQTREQKNAKQRIYYEHTDGAKKRAARRLRSIPLPLTGDCKPFYGLSFNSAEVQSTLTMWGGE